ncbi:hypothetical protein ACIP3U_12610 [[Kitasatospora] papulosa]|uniref:hypothetical protein n=1 Tax=[Kitasatospora] papulosa TaxID=1464011 RepID=UPI003800330F
MTIISGQRAPSRSAEAVAPLRVFSEIMVALNYGTAASTLTIILVPGSSEPRLMPASSPDSTRRCRPRRMSRVLSPNRTGFRQLLDEAAVGDTIQIADAARLFRSVAGL